MAVWTTLGGVRHPSPGRMAVNFARLPFYMGWRMTVVLRAVPTAMKGAWIRSPRE
jgi:hypothetical protein